MRPGKQRTESSSERLPVLTVLTTFLRLGLTSFGGPVAHLGYFREALVVRRRWLDEFAYADLVALCQFLPGPASSQVGIGIGLAKAGLPGAIAAWVGFTLPSALLLIAFGYGVVALNDGIPAGALHGLKIVAVAVVAQALLGMGRTLCPDLPRATLAAFCAAALIAVPSPLTQVLVIGVGAAVGFFLLRADRAPGGVSFVVPVGRYTSIAALVLFAVLLVSLPILAAASASHGIALADSFFRSGSLVFGGGHVVLPLLQAEVVPPGWVTNDAFLAGYGAAQAVPGPLFTFAAYLGTVMSVAPNGWSGALICLLSIFAPSFLLVIGVLPFWGRLREVGAVQRALVGVNAAVVGLLLAALYNPVWTSAIDSVIDLAFVAGAFVLLVPLKTPPWLVVALSAVGGWGLALVGSG